MRYETKLQEGIFLKRYKRFFADIEWQGQQITAHVPNTGSLKSVNNPGQHCLFSESKNPDRKLKFTLEMIRSPAGSWVGVNTATPNVVVREALEQAVGRSNLVGPFAHWGHYDEVKPEFKINSATRLDFALKRKGLEKMHFVEVKNVTLEDVGVAKFPDAVTERGQKHLRELMDLIDQGHTAEIVFTVQRHDCGSFAPADDIDPEYGRLLREAYHKGLKVSPFVVELTPEGAELSETLLPVKL